MMTESKSQEQNSTAASSPQSSTIEPIHLDTTLQIEQLKTPKRSERVRLGLSDYRFRSASTYARHEFNRTWIRNLVWLYGKVQRAQSRGEILGQISRAFQQQPNRMTTCLEIIEEFLDTAEGAMPMDVVLVRLRAHLASSILGAHVAWDRAVQHEFNGTGCVRAAIRPRLAPNGKAIFEIPKCVRTAINCRIHRFFQDHQPQFLAIADRAEALANPSAQLSETGRRLRTAAENPETLCDDRVCAKVGDALIAVDGLSIATYGANNDAEWRPIADALGKTLINPIRDR